jgi:hypothetical protein
MFPTSFLQAFEQINNHVGLLIELFPEVNGWVNIPLG